jgi:HEAT repeat protein
MVGSADRAIRVNAAKALARIGLGARSAVPALLDAIQDQYPEVRRWASEALNAIDPETARSRTPESKPAPRVTDC